MKRKMDKSQKNTTTLKIEFIVDIMSKGGFNEQQQQKNGGIYWYLQSI